MGRRHSQFKKILIGYDGSSQADRATDSALLLAQSLDAKVLVFAVGVHLNRQQSLK
jgi:nucleotide-binding universal stress UspA family protein